MSMTVVKTKIDKLLQSYADGLILDTDCLNDIMAACMIEQASIVTHQREDIYRLKDNIADLHIELGNLLDRQ